MKRHLSDKDGYETTNTAWRGVWLTIRSNRRWGGMCDICHIEVISADRQALPITATGYRSHFISPDQMAGYDNAVKYVLAWLEHKAMMPAWKQREADLRQMELF